jgi:site-specific DNA-methyltransferase (adenine-specific)/site-specific DNA-methyltransferase (cytosine-N4-specific)
VTVRILTGNALEVLRTLPAESVHMCLTSPPYWTQLDYGVEGQLGLEPTMEAHIDRLSEVLGELRRVLRRDGVFWLQYGDGYNTSGGGPGPGSSRAWLRKRARMPKLVTGFGLKSQSVKRKSLFGIPWRLALRLEAEGWHLRSCVVWRKPCPMERADLDRPVVAHEYVFMLTRSERNYWNGERCESVWEIQRQPVAGHPAPFPCELARRCIEYGCPPGGTVLDPFAGSGTTGLVADRLGRDAILIELSPEYAQLAEARIRGDAPLFVKIETV